ncbi:MAG: hypothetical protein J6I85_08440, partial [Clostridia bacterium]|nr:hypothetical protein [Clostridia bacterium]
IPTIPELINPAIVDELIEDKVVLDYTKEPIDIPVFNATLIETTNSKRTGIFTIIGEFLTEVTFETRFEFEIILISGEKAVCTLPRVSGKGEVRIECILQEELKDSKIMIEQSSILDGFKEIIKINKISTEEKVNVKNGKEIKDKKKFNTNISFGQVSDYKVENNLITFIFVGFSSEELKIGDSISMIVDLIIDGKLVEEKAICTVKENIAPKVGEQLKANFDCKVENVDKAEKCTGLEIIDSEDVINIPSIPELINPAIVDELIEAEEIIDYTSKEYKEIPVFNGTSIDTTNSRKTGTFTIFGEFLTEVTFETRFEFEIILVTGEKALCTLPRVSGKVEVGIECILQEELKDSKIMIEQSSILDGFKEIIKINKISTEEKVNVKNGKEIKDKKKFNTNISFGQVSDYKVANDIITFFFAGFSSEELKKDTTIKMIVNLIEGVQLIEEEAICTSKENVKPKDGKLLQVDFNCKIENVIEADKYVGLEIVKSDNITNIPTESELLNPAIVDELIENGEMKDLKIESNKNKAEKIPIFNSTSIDTSKSLTNGVFVIVGKLLSEFKLEEEFEFDIKLISGEKAKCVIPEITGDETEIKIECILQEELKDKKIMIEQFTVLDAFEEVIRINKICTEEKVNVKNGKEKQLNKKYNNDITFRQTNTFEFDSNKKTVKFVIDAFTSEPLKKGEEINVDVDLLLTIGSKKKEAKCKVNEDITISKSKLQEPVSLSCEVEKVELKKDIECIGLEIKNSEKISSIPNDPILCNPKKVDTLISLGKVEKTQKEVNIPEFNATSIDTTGSMSSGIFTIIGQLSNDIEKEFIFNITLVSGQTATCNLPKSKKKIKVEIECILDGTIENGKIMIPQSTIFNEYKEIFVLDKVSTERPVSCTNGKLKEKTEKLDKKIGFRQMSNFNSSDKNVVFTLSAFFLQNMKKGKQIIMDVIINIDNNSFIKEKAKCTLNKAVTGASKEKLVASDFTCSIDNLDNIDKVKGIELVSCDEITGIPNDPKMRNPIEVDKLIKLGEVKDYSLKENINIIPPVFKTSSLNSLSCRSSGVFTLKGTFDKNIEHFRFNLPLSYPVVDTRCDVPESKEGEEVEIICKTKSEFSSSKIIIEQSTITKEYSEIISLLPISSDNEVSCKDYTSVYTKKIEKEYVSPFIYKQTQNFKNDEGKIEFSLFAFKSDYFNQENSISIEVGLTRSTISEDLEKLPHINTDCHSASTNSNLVEFKCTLNGYPDTDGVIIFESYDVSGIPENKTLSNPSIIDTSIKEGKTKDCTNEDCSLPIFKEGKLSEIDSNNGTIIIEGIIDGYIPDGSIFKILIYPESYGDCNINNNTKKIECYNKEEIHDSKIVIKEIVVKDEYDIDLFILKGIISDNNDIYCLINNNKHNNSENINTDLIDNTTDINTVDSTVSDLTDNITDEISENILSDTTDKVSDTVISESSDKTTDKVSETVISESTDKTTDKVSDTVISESSDKTTDKVSETVISESTDKTTDKVSDTVISES